MLNIEVLLSYVLQYCSAVDSLPKPYIFKGQTFNKESVLDMRTHLKPTETFQYAFFTTCHPPGAKPGAKKGFVKGEALRLLRTNSSIKTFEENITTFKKHLMERGYPQNFINNTLSEVKFQERTQALLQRNKRKKTNLSLRNTIPPSSSKSQRNLNEEVVPNTATTIAKSNLQGTAHNIIQQARREWGCDGCTRTPPQAAEVHFFVDQRCGRLELGTLMKDHDY